MGDHAATSALLGETLSDSPGLRTYALEDWVDKGDWQSLAALVRAESIFFVDRDPSLL